MQTAFPSSLDTLLLNRGYQWDCPDLQVCQARRNGYGPQLYRICEAGPSRAGGSLGSLAPVRPRGLWFYSFLWAWRRAIQTQDRRNCPSLKRVPACPPGSLSLTLPWKGARGDRSSNCLSGRPAPGRVLVSKCF